MHRIDNPSASASLPTPKPLGPEGYFIAGNPNTGQPATIVEYDWMNTVQEELMTIILKGGLTSDKNDNTQVLRALANLFTGAFIQVGMTQQILVPPYASQIGFQMVGAGAGGGHCQSDGTNFVSGAGGGSGAYLEAQRPVTPGALLTAIVGVGGIGEAPGGTTSLSFPGNWTASAGGGSPAEWVGTASCSGGIGGVPSGGDLQSLGTFGGDGQAEGLVEYATGNGGPGPWGGGVRAGDIVGSSGSEGAPGLGPGAGGAGVYDTAATGRYVAGGTGANGIIQYRWLP